MAYETILCERRDAVALVTLNRKARLNAMNATMLHEFHRAMDELEADNAVRAVVLTGAGASFCSGFDLQEQAAHPPAGVAEWRSVLRRDFDAIMRFWHSPKPTIAAVRAYEIMGMGEALETALDIDLEIEGQGTADKRQFLEIARRDGLRAALAWRDARFSPRK